MEIPIRLERGGVPLERQLTEQMRAAILSGRLPAGSRLASTRELARTLGVSRNVAVAAYDELFAEGYVEGRRGSGTYVAEGLTAPARSALPASSQRARWLRHEPPVLPDDPTGWPGAIVFRLGQPSLESLPARAWRQAWLTVAGQPPPGDYAAPAGIPELRAAIAAHIGRARGVVCGPEDVVITSGAAQAVGLVARAVLAPGDPAAIEEPGYPAAQQSLRAAGARLLPVAVDGDGLRVELLPLEGEVPLLVYVTPSHQYPLGMRLSIARRMALLDWARRTDSLIVEDDYDSEFRFDAEPLPALASLDQDGRVAYVGTFSKVLSPALRVGYLVASAPLRERVERLKRIEDHHTPWPEQVALAAFMRAGELERHIRRMRRLYAEKRRTLAESLAPVSDLARLCGLEAGLHAFLETQPEIDPRRVVERARERAPGAVVSTVESYYLDAPDRRGLLLGYGGLTLEQIRLGGRVVAEAMRAAAG